MVLGIGTDILKISNIASAISTPNDPFITATYTEAEIQLICSRKIPLYSYATRFAGKEAIFKTLSADGNKIRLNEIEILEKATGEPYVILHGTASLAASKKGIAEVFISLSYDTDYAIAYATALGMQK